MTTGTLILNGQKFRLLPEAEYRRWQRESRAARTPRKAPVEVYSPQRKAQFLLTNAIDAADYRRACKLVREMGLDPAKIDHDKPAGVR